MASLQKYLKMTAVASAIVMTAAACTKEDLSGCPVPGVDIICTYTLNEYGADRFHDEVEYVDFFVYDGSGALTATFRKQTNEMSEADEGLVAEKSIVLPAGSYTVVGWGNILQDTSHSYVRTENYDDARLETVCEETAEGLTVRKTLPSVFFGSTTLEVPLSQIASCHLSMTKNTSDVHIIIEGPGNYDISLSASNGFYTFMNTPSDETAPRMITYYPENANEPLSSLPAGHSAASKAGTDGWHNTIRTQSLYIGDDSMVTIRLAETGETLLTRSLTGMICEDPSIATDEDLARRDHHDLRFEVDALGLPVLVQVNDWKVHDQSTGVGL